MFDGQDDADRDSDEIGFVFALSVAVFNRGIDQDKPDILVAFVAGAFVEVEGVSQENSIKFKPVGDVLQFVRRKGRSEMHPTARLQLVQFYESSFFACIITDHYPLSVKVNEKIPFS